MARLAIFTGGEPIPFGYPNDDMMTKAIEGIRESFAKEGGAFLSMTTGGDGQPIKAGLLWVPKTVPIVFEFDGPVPQSLASQMTE